MSTAHANERPAIVVDGHEYVSVETYDRVVGYLQSKLKMHVQALDEIEARLRRLEVENKETV